MNKTNKAQCPEVNSTLILYLYGEAFDPAAFESHLEKCAECRRVLEGHRRVVGAYREQKIEAPQGIQAIPLKSLWWKGVTDFLFTPLRPPVPVGAMALIVIALFVLAVIRPVQQIRHPANVPSYTEIEARLNAIDYNLDNLFTVNVAQEEETQAESQLPEHKNLTDLSSELEELGENITTF